MGAYTGYIQLITLSTINGIEIKERYGAEFRKIKRVQNMPRYIVVPTEWSRKLTQYEFKRLSAAVKFAKNPTYQGGKP